MKKSIAKITRVSILIILAFVIHISSAEAQQERHRYGQQGSQKSQKYEKIESQRIAFITQELNLTPDEAKVFWPVYNEYDAKRHELRKTYKNANDLDKAELDKITEKEALQILDTQLIEAQKLLDLRKEYNIKFKSVLPAVKVLKLYDAEREFQKMLIDRLRQHKQGPNPTPEK